MLIHFSMFKNSLPWRCHCWVLEKSCGDTETKQGKGGSRVGGIKARMYKRARGKLTEKFIFCFKSIEWEIGQYCSAIRCAGCVTLPLIFSWEDATNEDLIWFQDNYYGVKVQGPSAESGSLWLSNTTVVANSLLFCILSSLHWACAHLLSPFLPFDGGLLLSPTTQSVKRSDIVYLQLFFSLFSVSKHNIFQSLLYIMICNKLSARKSNRVQKSVFGCTWNLEENSPNNFIFS